MSLYHQCKARKILRATGIATSPEEWAIVVSPYSPWGPLSIIDAPLDRRIRLACLWTLTHHPCRRIHWRPRTRQGAWEIIPCPDIARDKTDKTAYRAYNELRNLYIMCRWKGVKTCKVHTSNRPAERMTTNEETAKDMDCSEP